MNKLLEWKFIVALSVVLSSSTLCGFGRIDGTVLAAIIVPVVGAFLAADVTQAVLLNQKAQEEVVETEARSMGFIGQ